MRKSSWGIIVIASVVAGIYESSFIGSSPLIFAYIRPIIPACIIFFLLNKRPAAYTMAVISGSIIDLMSATSAGFITGRWLLVLLVIDLLSQRVTTNRSLYATLALVTTARLFDRSLWQILSWLAEIILKQTIYLEPWSRLLGIFISDLIITTVTFVSITLFTKRFVIAVNAYKGRYDR